MPDTQRIQPNCDRASREAFLKAKYVEKKWIPVIEDWQAHVAMLMRRKKPFKPTTLLSALVQPSADINWHRPGNQKTLLHKCVAANNLVSALLLLKLECQVDSVDSSGMTPLHIAAQVNSAPMARLLMQHGASTTSLDSQKRTPRDVAIDHDAVDCIVLLDDDLNSEMGASSGTGEMPSPHLDSISAEPRYHSSILPRSFNSTSSTSSSSVTASSMPSINSLANPIASTPMASAQKKRRPTQASAATSSATVDVSHNSSAPSTPPPKERFQSLSLRSASQLPTELADQYRDGIVEATSMSARGPSPSHDIDASMANVLYPSSSQSLTTDEKRGGMRKSKSAKSVSIPSSPSAASLPAPLPSPIQNPIPSPLGIPPPLDVGPQTSTASAATSSAPVHPLHVPLTLPPPSFASPRDTSSGSKSKR